jgi:hypothetical protein
MILLPIPKSEPAIQLLKYSRKVLRDRLLNDVSEQRGQVKPDRVKD